ncbi:Chromatin modification-related protein Eaf6 [Dillenia turbinata]|uniref:Chromatin modification-related protein Eaf6 n=1 Tax=Dillenia turbinata TaxID=194707 RepID=A0AAN8VUZ6_9MAGN
MDSEGQRGSTNPTAAIASLLSRRAKHHEELRSIEKQVYEMETSYLQDPSQCGNVLKGFEGFLSSSKSTTLYSLFSDPLYPSNCKTAGSTSVLFFSHSLLDNQF